MASPNLKVKFTYQDYLHMPEDKRYELIEGEFFMMPSPKEYHQRILMNLSAILYNFARESKSGIVYVAPFDVVFSEENVVQPDIVFVSKERKNIITKDNIKGAPDLLIEILSPNISYRDNEIKRKLYFKYGVKEYWIVDPDGQTIEVLSIARNSYKTSGIYNINTPLSSPLLKGLLIDLKEVF